MRHLIASAVAFAALLASPRAPGAQRPVDASTPRALADSTYAVRLELDRIAEMIRRGDLDGRRYGDAELAGAVRRLALAALRRTRRPPREELGAAWDFGFRVTAFEPEGPGRLRLRAQAVLATDADDAGQPVVLTFRRAGAEWLLEGHQGLVPRLGEISARLTRGDAP